MAKAVKPKENLILLIDEDKSRASNTSSRLRLSGYDTELCGSGFHAIHLIEKSQELNKCYILTVICGDTEDMPGREVLNLVRNVYDKKQMPVLYMAESNEAEEILQMIKEGANDYIVVTDNFQKILTKIQKLAPIKAK